LEKGAFENLLRRSKKEPDKCIAHSDYVSWGYLDGKQVVYDCPCNGASRYEKLFWDSRYIIEKYFQNRTKKISETARREETISKNISDSLEKIKNS